MSTNVCSFADDVAAALRVKYLLGLMMCSMLWEVKYY